MIFTAPMSHLTAVVRRNDADAVATTLLRLGVLHLVRLRDVEPDTDPRLKQESVDEARARVAETRRRVETMLQLGNLSTPAPVPANAADVQALDVDGVNRNLDGLARELESVRASQRQLQQEIHRLEDVRRQLATFGDLGSQIRRSEEHSVLNVQAGRLRSGVRAGLEGDLARYPCVVVPVQELGTDELVLVISMKRNAAEVQQALQRRGFQEQEIPATSEAGDVDVLADVDRKITHLRSRQEQESRKLEQTLVSRRDELADSWQKLRVRELLLTVRAQSTVTEHTTVITGWVPKDQRRRLERAVRDATNGTYYLEWHTAEEMRHAGASTHVPSNLHNPRFLRPFQMLVTNYGVPEYGTIDPTPLVALAYLVMFGLMFGDAGHGLVLVVLGLVGGRLLRKGATRQRSEGRDRGNQTFQELARLVVWCGGASIFTGVLFGSYFGMGWFPPLWFDYHGIVAGHAQAGVFRSIFDILTLTIYLGVAVIGAGLVLNWINLVRRRRWFRLLFDKSGLLGGIMYAAGVWMAGSFAASGFRALPTGPFPLLLIGVPAITLFFRSPLEWLLSRRRPTGVAPDHRLPNGGDAGADEAPPVQPEARHASPLWWLMEWVIELLEIFSGYLANTLSFMRVAGLGIAHVTLMIAFFQIAEMAAPDGHTVVSVLILVLGNALVVALEGLSAGIQSLRLNYYEFFSKYFVASGYAYTPISLESRS